MANSIVKFCLGSGEGASVENLAYKIDDATDLFFDSVSHMRQELGPQMADWAGGKIFKVTIELVGDFSDAAN